MDANHGPTVNRFRNTLNQEKCGFTEKMRSMDKAQTNETVQELAEEPRVLMKSIRERKIRFDGRTVLEDGLVERLCAEGRASGARGRGRPRTTLL